MRQWLGLGFLFVLFVVTSSLAQEEEHDPSFTHPLEPILTDLGAYECPGAASLQCVTLPVPLDPFRNDDEGEILEVTFGIHPATGERRGTLVVAVGGPGMAGIINGQYYLDANRFGNGVLNTMDIIFFDQRGIGLSYGVDCPQAISRFYQNSAYVTPYTPADEERLIDINRVYAKDCIEEMNADWLLPYLSTKFAVHDLAVFLDALGDDAPVYLYGESYGTQYAQTFAVAYPERIKGLILDGVVDLTLSGEAYYAEAVEGGHKILLEYLNACNADLICSSDMGRDAVVWYEELGAKIAASSINVEVRLPDGQVAARVLDSRAYRAAMGTQEPVILLRALAATRENYEPLLRLAYVQQGKSLLLDEVTLPPLSSSSTIPAEDSSVDSEAAYNNVDCADYEFFSGSPDERARAYMRAGDELEQRFPYFPTDNFYYDLACPYWLVQGSALRPKPFEGGRYPTFIINGTADRPTPISNGYRVFGNVRNGFMITTRAGGHVNFGGVLPCPDQFLVDFIVDGLLPAEREYICDGDYFEKYAPLQTKVARDYTSALELMQDLATEIVHQPEFLQVIAGSSASIGCRYGGTMYASPNPASLSFAGCELIQGVALTGHGTYSSGETLATGDMTLEVIVRGDVSGNIRFSHLNSTGALSITGEFEGQAAEPQP